METRTEKQVHVTVSDANGGSPLDVPFSIHSFCQQMASLHAKVDVLTTKFDNLQSQVNHFMRTGNNIQRGDSQSKTSHSEPHEAAGDAELDSGFQQSCDTNFLNVPRIRNRQGFIRSSWDSEASEQSAESDFIQVTGPNIAKETRRPSCTTDINATPNGNTEENADEYIQVGIKRDPRTESKFPNVNGMGIVENETNQHYHMDICENATSSGAKSNLSKKDDRAEKNPHGAFDSSPMTDTDNTISNFFKLLPSENQEPGNKLHGENTSEKANAFSIDQDDLKIHDKQPQQTDFLVEDKTELSQETLTYKSSQQASSVLPDSSSDTVMDQDKTAMEHLVLESARKRSHAANFGDAIPQAHPPSPVPFAKCKVRTPYSDFKRRKTDIFEDNRPKYFDKMLDVISVGEFEDPEPTDGYSAAVSSTEQLKAGTKELQPEEPANSFVERTSLSNLLNGSPHPRNNEQLPDSGFRNEHGYDDNRFVQEVHTVSAQQSHDEILSNISVILTGNPQHRFYGQDILGSSNHDRDERNGGAGRNPLNAKRTVPDTELAAIVKREKQKAQQCSDPKCMHGIDTVLCLDTSASMKGQPFRKARDFIIRFLEGLGESSSEYSLEENVAIVTYGNSNQVLQHLTKDYSLARSKLELLKPDGPSPLWLGIGLCLTELSTRGGSCTMDSQTVLPRIIIISDFFASVRNVLQGPDIRQLDQKGNSEVTGLIGKNKKTCTFNFVMVKQRSNMTLLQQMGRDQLFTTDDVFYLSQYFRAQNLVNIVLTERVGQEVDEQFIRNAVKQRGMTERWQRDVIELVKEKTPKTQAVEEVNYMLVPNSTESYAAGIDEPAEPEFGARIKANPNWAGYHSRQGMSGVVVAPRKNGFLKVQWEDGTQEKVKYGADDEYDIVVDEREPGDEKLKIGTVVERGQDWRWANQDGGPGNIGVVCSYDEKKMVVEVIWHQGGKGNYRYGYKGRFDVTVRKSKDRMAMSEQ